MPKEEKATNVKVAVRVRPLNDRERQKDAKVCIRMVDKRETHITNPETGQVKSFSFDRSYWMDAEQKEVYQDLGSPLLHKAFEGYNGTIFAYGQTGSGKTYSMAGVNDGIVPQMNQEMYETIEKGREKTRYLVTVSYLEIYNEVIHDLLNPSDKELKIREHPKLGVYIDGIAEIVAKSGNEIQALMDQGNKVRQVAATNMNAQSSRSHSVFTVKLQQRELEASEDKPGLSAKINLVDLAGSERVSSTGATGDRLKEGAAINKSLSSLGNVINALADPKKAKGHIPYRDSKLTRVLQESLGGNTMTIMIAALSPADINHDETLSTLNYANRAKNIQNKTRKNEDENQRIIRELREEIERLRTSVTGSAQDGQVVDTTKMTEMERMIDSLKVAKQESWEEKERISKLFEVERKKNLESKGIMEYVMDNLRRESRELKERMQKLQEQKKKMLEEYKQRSANRDKLKEKLQTELKTYSQKVEEARQKTGSDEIEDDREFRQRIEQLRVGLKQENEKLKETKLKLQKIAEQQKKEKEDAQAHSAVLAEDSDLRRAIADEERQRLTQENEAHFAKMKAKMQEDLENEKKQLEVKYADESGAGVSQSELHRMEMELIQAKADKAMLLKENEIMKDQLQNAENAITEMKLNHEMEVEKQQLEHFQIFRRYREELERHRRQRESQLTELLELAIADSIHLSSVNAEQRQELEDVKGMMAGYSETTLPASAQVW